MSIEEDDPLWRRIFLNELVWAFVAGIVILYFAFSLATSKSETEDPKPKVRDQKLKG